VNLRNPDTGKVATIKSVNFDQDYKNVFIQSATLNGRTYTKNWIDHGFFLDGGVLELVLGDEESEWGTNEKDVPPSYSTTGPLNGTWDSSSPSRDLRKPKYTGLFGPDPGFDSLRLFFLALILFVVAGTIIVICQESSPVRKGKKKQFTA